LELLAHFFVAAVEGGVLLEVNGDLFETVRVFHLLALDVASQVIGVVIRSQETEQLLVEVVGFAVVLGVALRFDAQYFHPNTRLKRTQMRVHAVIEKTGVEKLSAATSQELR